MSIVKSSLSTHCFTPNFPGFVFGMIKIAHSRFASISLVLCGPLAQILGVSTIELFRLAPIAKSVYILFDCVVQPRAACCVRVVSHVFGCTSYPQSGLRSRPKLFSSFPLLLSLSPLYFPTLCPTWHCTWFKGAPWLPLRRFTCLRAPCTLGAPLRQRVLWWG